MISTPLRRCLTELVFIMLLESYIVWLKLTAVIVAMTIDWYNFMGRFNVSFTCLMLTQSWPRADPELKGEAKTNFVTHTNGLNDLIHYYSTLHILQKAIAWLLRYETYCCVHYRKRDENIKLKQGKLTLQNNGKMQLHRELNIFKKTKARLSRKSESNGRQRGKW